MIRVIKRNGSNVEFDRQKIFNAVKKAIITTDNAEISAETADNITDSIIKVIEKKGLAAIQVEDIQDIVEDTLMKYGAYNVARGYIKYRFQHQIARKANTTDEKILSIVNGTNDEVKAENANKNPVINSTQRDYIAGEVSRDLCDRVLLPEHISKAHKEGIIHFHDSDYFAQRMYNCCLVNLQDMFENGTVITGTKIDRPHSFPTACNIATQIIAQVASNQYGGQSISLSHLAPFVAESRKKITAEVLQEEKDAGIKFSDEVRHKIIERRVRTDIERGVQTIQYQVITLMTTNGQAPFVTVFMYLGEVQDIQTKKDLALVIEEVLKQRIKGVKNEKGVYVTPAFPKLIYVLEEDNITEDSPYWNLTKLAAQCSAKRLVPDYISEKKMKELKEGNCFPVMGCRSALSPWKDENGNYKFYGRFNQGVVTLNLPDVALSAKAEGGNDTEIMDRFWKILSERLILCHDALMCRHNRLKGTTSDVAPILWQHGAIARLKKGEKIDKLLYNGYSTISLGYAGLAECVYALKEVSHTTEEGMKLGLRIMEFMNAKCDEWTAETSISFGIYGTPLESTTYKFAKCLRKRFGVVKGVSDKNYITNSYHVHVTEEIDAFHKLEFESKFQALSKGGAISYVEIPNMQKNIEVVLALIKFIYENIMYAELNTKSDYCQECGYDGEIMLVDDNGNLVWECPNCGNRNFDTMNIARRVCGYIGTNLVNQGRLAEYSERVLHL